MQQIGCSQKREQKIPFLYLANDILQNSKRTGTEFVGEFWKVLPTALKDVIKNGDDHGKNVVSRLVDIWEERRVFGSRAQGLKDLMLGNEPLPALELNKKRSRSSVRIVRRDSRTKLSVGGMAEKVVSAFHNVISEQPNEDMDLNKCKDAVRRVGKLEKDVDHACSRVGDPRRETLANELLEHETTLKQFIEKLKSFEANREALVSQLKAALQEQESALENVRTQLQLAQGMVEEAANMQRRLNDEPVVSANQSSSAEPPKPHTNGRAAQPLKKSTAAIAAEVADKLAASTHSQQIMTSVLSTFAAEEAKNAGLVTSANLTSSFTTMETPDKRTKVEKPMPVSDSATTTAFVPVQPVVVSASHQPQTVLRHQTSIQNQASATQPQYNLFQGPTQQYLQPSGGLPLMGVPYSYNAVPPLPPAAPQMMNLIRPLPLSQQQQSVALVQQPPPPPPMPMNQLLPINQQPANQPIPINQQPVNQSMPINPQPINQSMPINQQPAQFNLQQPVPPSYRPLQPPSMTFYHQTQ
ncbi:formin-like protein 7 [Cocos nucifera]|uniref:Formin-like protein 7 n=1 Tax=Cocos nucifera TaxID=13894 RepID=A0A8K0I614_COCNU|nr:formin-like protein 7 [Cocos nucifera]